MNVLDWLGLFFRWGSKPSSCIKPFLSHGQWWAQIFKYSNIQIKWLLNILLIRICAIFPVRIYLDLHSYIFGRANIFKYLLVNSWKSEFIWIFVQNLILIIFLIIKFKVYLDIVYVSKNIPCKILFRGSMIEPFWSVISTNIRIF